MLRACEVVDRGRRPMTALFGRSVVEPVVVLAVSVEYHSAPTTSSLETLLLTVPAVSHPSCSTAPLNCCDTTTFSTRAPTDGVPRTGPGVLWTSSSSPPLILIESSLVRMKLLLSVQLVPIQIPNFVVQPPQHPEVPKARSGQGECRVPLWVDDRDAVPDERPVVLYSKIRRDRSGPLKNADPEQPSF